MLTLNHQVTLTITLYLFQFDLILAVLFTLSDEVFAWFDLSDTTLPWLVVTA